MSFAIVRLTSARTRNSAPINTRPFLLSWASLVLAVITCSGCDQSPVPPPEPDHCASAVAIGTMYARDRPSGLLIAAPHDGYDLYTGDIVKALCDSISTDCLVATGYVVNGTRLNVNRPSEGVGLSAVNEPRTERSSCVYEEYRSLIKLISDHDGPGLYVEIHGAGITNIQIATVGITHEQAISIREILQTEWTKEGSSAVDILVEPADTIQFTASAAKSFGILKTVPRALHIELPRDLRENKQQRLISFLQKSIPIIEEVL